MLDKKMVSQTEINKHMEQLAKVREPYDPPTREEVIALILRMKKRWGIC